jgi:exopolyphosphatase/guanosine-5'-triphosphate,3'-diphosphate pyrophosphatase
MRIASIDLGTNTFNLLIADVDGKDLHIVHRDKRGVKLGRNGINRKTISADAWERGISTLADYAEEIKQFGPDRVAATATSAIRNADNGSAFIKEVYEKFGITIRIIDGKEEARLIYKGVCNAVPIGHEPVLIMDIGGGSIEFIIADNSGILWHNSFEAGASRLLELFNPSEPITTSEIQSIENHIEQQAAELFEMAQNYRLNTLIGSSGSFDALANMASFILNGGPVSNDSKFFEIPLRTYRHIHQILLQSTTEQRINIPGMDLIRVELIVIGSILIHHIINKLALNCMIQSSYAIKEGVIFDAIGK